MILLKVSLNIKSNQYSELQVQGTYFESPKKKKKIEFYCKEGICVKGTRFAIVFSRVKMFLMQV